MHELVNFAIEGRESAYKIAYYFFPSMVVRGLVLSRDKMRSFDNICSIFGSKSFFISDENSSNFFRHIKDSKNFDSFINAEENKRHFFFHIYKYIEGIKISFDLAVAFGMIQSKKCFSYTYDIKKEIDDSELDRIVGKDISKKLNEVVSNISKFVFDEYFIENANIKVKFIIGADGRIYLYKLYKYKI